MSEPRHDLLAALPKLVAEKIHRVLPRLRDCRAIAGRFDLDSLKRIGVAAPAVLVSRLGARQAEALAGPHITFELDMAAFIVTKDAPGLQRDEAASNISQALLRLIPENCWGQVGVGAAQRVREQSLITSASEKEAISLWAITWMQPAALAGYPVALRVPISLYVGGDEIEVPR